LWVETIANSAFGCPLGGLIEQVPTDTSTGTNMAFNDTHTWGGNKVNELRLGYNRSSIVRRENEPISPAVMSFIRIIEEVCKTRARAAKR